MNKCNLVFHCQLCNDLRRQFPFSFVEVRNMDFCCLCGQLTSFVALFSVFYAHIGSKHLSAKYFNKSDQMCTNYPVAPCRALHPPGHPLSGLPAPIRRPRGSSSVLCLSSSPPLPGLSIKSPHHEAVSSHRLEFWRTVSLSAADLEQSKIWWHVCEVVCSADTERLRAEYRAELYTPMVGVSPPSRRLEHSSSRPAPVTRQDTIKTWECT